MSSALKREVPPDSRLSPEDFEFFRANLERLCGITLAPTKASLVESRLRRRVELLGLSGYAEYRRLLGSEGEGGAEWQAIVNALTTHTTEWFREVDHFHQLRKEIVPRWLASKPTRPLRVLSAACSTGEEPYSIALVLNWFQDRHGLEYEITAADVDTNVIEKARRGRYLAKDLERIPEEYRPNALAVGTGPAADFFKVRQHVRDRVQFSQLNLAHRPYEFRHRFDLVFCRNVFIYFPPEFIARVAEGLHRVAAPGATLFIGHSESFSSISVPWKYVRPSVYKKEGDK